MDEHPVSSRFPRPPAWVVDVALATATSVAAVGSVAASLEPGARTPDEIAYALAATLGAALLARRRYPLAVLALSAVLVLLYHVLGYPAIGPAVLGPALYTAAVRAGLLWGSLVAAAVAAVELGWRIGVEAQPPLEVLVTSGWFVGIMLAALLLGDAVRSRRALAAETTERLRLAAAQQDAEADRRVAEERLRISRELHDVLAHTVAGIGVQARVLDDSLDRHPDHARSAAAAIKQAIGEATTELRSIVGVLRRADGESLTPAPSLAGLSVLVASLSTGGVDSRVEVEGTPRALPDVVDMTAYRVIQEALTNILRHAGASEATVSLRYAPRTLTITVTDDGAGGAHAATPGLGIRGMQERARAVGGYLTVGPRHDGNGTEVVAELPLEAAQ